MVEAELLLLFMNALNLFWKKGYEATSLNDLTKELGIGKGSFYNTFGSKKELFEQCLHAYKNHGQQTVKEVLKGKPDPVIGLKYFLDFHTKTMLDDPSLRGCLIANSTTELAHDSKIQAFLLDHNSSMRTILNDYLSGTSLDSKKEGLVDSILIYITGISVLTKFNQDPEHYKKANESFLKSII